MMIIGCDLHTRYQQIAMVDTDDGELVERRLEHESGEARAFYAGLKGAVRVGIESPDTRPGSRATLATELGHELWMGDAKDSRGGGTQAEDRRARRGASVGAVVYESVSGDLAPVAQERDLRQLLWHRQKLVWMWGAVKNQMHALAMGEGVCRKKKLFTKRGESS